MSRCAIAVALCGALLSAPAFSAEQLPLRDITADGTWDCNDIAGANTGTVVVAENTYAFIETDGKLGGYGNLHLMDTDTGTPKFVIVSGYLKDEFGASGASLTGPRGDTENWTELYLYVALSPDRDRNWYCARRTAVGGAPETVQLTYYVTDGTWDCTDRQGGERGVVVLADIVYAYIKPDGRLGGYGKLFKLTTNLDLPHYAEISGYMKDTFGSQGVAPRGPRDNPHDLSGQIYLNVILSKDGAGAEDWDCERRVALEP